VFNGENVRRGCGCTVPLVSNFGGRDVDRGDGVRADGGPRTVEDHHGTAAPAEVDGVDLKTDGCPVCDCMTFEEFPAGYYHCEGCGCVWSGEPTNASIAEYFGPSLDDLEDADESLPVDIDGKCRACLVNPREEGTRHCSGCHEALAADGGSTSWNYGRHAEIHADLYETRAAEAARRRAAERVETAAVGAAALLNELESESGEERGEA